MWDPRQPLDSEMLLHLLKKFVAETASEEVVRMGLMYGIDREQTDRVAKAVELAVRSTIARTFSTSGSQRRHPGNTADAWLWNTLEDRLGALEMLVIKGHYDHEKRKDSQAKAQKKKTQTQRQSAVKKLSAFLNQPDHRLRLTGRVYQALMDDLQQLRSSKLAGLTPAAFLRELKQADGGKVGRVVGIGPQALSELREVLSR